MVSLLITAQRHWIIPRNSAEKTEPFGSLYWFRARSFSGAIHSLLAWLNRPSITFRCHRLQHAASEEDYASFEIVLVLVVEKSEDGGSSAEEVSRLAQTTAPTRIRGQWTLVSRSQTQECCLRCEYQLKMHATKKCADLSGSV